MNFFFKTQDCTKMQGKQHWPRGATLAEKLWGSKQDLMKTTDFITDTHLLI